jgi:hypothetical protein
VLVAKDADIHPPSPLAAVASIAAVTALPIPRILSRLKASLALLATAPSAVGRPLTRLVVKG